MKDLTKNLVLKRDKGCIICNSHGKKPESLKQERDPGVRRFGHDGGEISDVRIGIASTPPEPNGLHVHHEWGVYGHKASNVPLQNWPWRNIKFQMVVLCPSHHARRHQETHYSEIKIIRKHLYKLYPTYDYSQFGFGGV